MARVGVLILGIVVLLFGTLALAGSAVPGVGRPEHLVESFVVEPGGALRVVGVNGRITYETWEGDEVVIEALQYKPRLSRAWPGACGANEGRLFPDRAGRAGGGRAAGPARVLQRRPCGVLREGPRGWHGDVTLTTSNGAIVESDIHGRVALNTSNGAVTVTAIRARWRCGRPTVRCACPTCTARWTGARPTGPLRWRAAP